MATNILMNIGYNRYIKLPKEMSAEATLAFLSLTKYYDRCYKTDKFQVHPITDVVSSNVFLIAIDDSELPDINPEVVQIQEILSENNRLTRENDALQRKIDELTKPVTPSNDVVVIDA